MSIMDSTASSSTTSWHGVQHGVLDSEAGFNGSEVEVRQLHSTRWGNDIVGGSRVDVRRAVFNACADTRVDLVHDSHLHERPRHVRMPSTIQSDLL
jgi:hypothetical protein